MKNLAHTFINLALLASALTLIPAVSHAADVELWRLDCGRIAVRDLDLFSDTYDYAGQSKTLTDSCYLIRHGDTYMLWDAGLPKSLLGAAQDPKAALAPTLSTDLQSQLRQIGVAPARISLIGISHDHFDHMGQAGDFPQATLMIGAPDWQEIQTTPEAFGIEASESAHWLTGGGKVDPVSGDRDVFGDGSVTMLAMPGHTPGEMALMVRLDKAGPVLLSGDVVHFEAQLTHNIVPVFNWSRADSLASMDRLRGIVRSQHATLIVQHDPDDIARLPAFPASAR